MAQFNLTAQIQLQAPNNTSQVVQQIQRGLQGVTVPIQIQANQRAMAGANKQISSIGKNANVAGRNMAFFNRNLAEAARRFSVITVATGSFIALARAIKNSVGAAVEFEREMIKISQVTGNTVSQLSSLSNEVTRISTSFGVANQSLLETARVLSQAGLSAQKTKQAMQVLANTTLAPTFDNIIDTTEGAIAILNQFGREAAKVGQDIKFLENALDSINKVSKNFAVESSDLITAVRRTGGVFQAAGGNLNELIALFTSVRQTTRESAETIATGFRTIFTRLQRTETIDALKELGIQLSDAEGKFIGPLKAIEALSIGLAGLDPKDLRFNEIVEQLGGFRQIGKVIPLIKQYSVAQEALAVANSASGDTAKDALLAQQGLGVQFEKVKQQFDALMRRFADSDTFRGLASTVLDLATAFIKFAESLERVLPQLTAFAALKIGRSLAPGLLAMGGRGAGRNMGGRIHGFSGGGWVPGTGSRDTVPAMLTPGEFVIKKSSATKLGQSTLADMNARGYASGGKVSSFRNAYGPKGPKFDQQIDPLTGKPIAAGAQVGFALKKSKGEKTSATPTIPKDKTLKLVEGQIFQAIERAEAKNLKDELSVGAAFLQPEGVDDYNFRSDLNIFQNPKAESVLESIVGGKIRSLYPEVTPQDIDKVFQNFKGSSKGNVGVNMYLGSLNKGTKELIQSAIPEGLAKELQTVQQSALPAPMSFNKGKFKSAFQAANTSQIEGGIFEAFLAGVSNRPFDKAASSNDTWDFPGGLGAKLASALNLAEVANNETDAKRSLTDHSLGSVFKKAATTFAENEAATIAQGILGAPKPQKANSGGSISGSSDTVPALLTPGEFVVKKSAAQSIGYGNLSSMNKTGIARFNKGGTVGGYFSKFNEGGSVSGVGSASGAVASEDALVKNTQALAQARDNVKMVMSESAVAEENLQQNTNELATVRENVKSSLSESSAVEEKLQQETTELANKRNEVTNALGEASGAEEALQNKTKALADKRSEVGSALTEAKAYEESLQQETKELAGKRGEITSAIADARTFEETLQTETMELTAKRGEITAAIADARTFEEALQTETQELSNKRNEVTSSLADAQQKEEALQTETQELANKRNETTSQLAESSQREEELQGNTSELSQRREKVKAGMGESLGLEEQLQSKTKSLSDRRHQVKAQMGETLQLEEQTQGRMRQNVDKLNQQIQTAQKLVQAEEEFAQKLKEAGNKVNRTGVAGTNLGGGGGGGGGGNTPPASKTTTEFSKLGGQMQKFGGVLNQASGALIGLGFVLGTMIQENESLTEAQKKVEQAYYNTISVYGGLMTQFVSLGAEVASSILLMAGRRAAAKAEQAAIAAKMAADAGEVVTEQVQTVSNTVNSASTDVNTFSKLKNTIMTNLGTVAMIALTAAVVIIVGSFIKLKAETAAAIAELQNFVDASNKAAEAELEKVGSAKGGADREAFIKARQDAAGGEIQQKLRSQVGDDAAASGGIGAAIGAVTVGLTSMAVALAVAPEPFVTKIAAAALAIGAAVGAVIGWFVGMGDPIAEFQERLLKLAPILELSQDSARGFAEVTFDTRSAMAAFDNNMRTFADGTLNATQKLDLLASSTGSLITSYESAEKTLAEATAKRKELEEKLIKEGIISPITGEQEDSTKEDADAKDAFGVLKELRKQEQGAYSDHNKILQKVFQQEAKLRTEAVKALSAYVNKLSETGRPDDVLFLASSGSGAALPMDLLALSAKQAAEGNQRLAAETKKLAQAQQLAFLTFRRSNKARFEDRKKSATDKGDTDLLNNLKQQEIMEEQKYVMALAKANSDILVAKTREIISSRREILQRLRLRKAIEQSQTALRAFNDVLLNAAARTARNFDVIATVIDGVAGPIQIGGEALGESLQEVSNNLLGQTLARGSISVRGGNDFDASNFTSGIAEAKTIIDAIPSSLEGVSADLSKPVNDQIKDLKTKLEAATGIADVSTIPVLGPIIMDQLAEMLDQAGGNPIGPDQVQPLIDMIEEAIEPNLEVLKRSIEIQNQYLEQINRINTAIVAAQGRFIEAVARIADVRARSRDRIADATGKRRDTADRERERRQAAQTRLTGTGAVAGNVQSSLNAAIAQRNQSRANKQRAKDIAAGRVAGDGTGLQELNRLDQEAQQAADGFNRARAEIERLADQSALASDIMAEIQEEQKKRQQLRALGEDIAFGSDKQRKAIADEFNTLQQAVNQGGIQGANEKQRAQVLSALDKLPDVIIGNTGKTGRELKAQFQADEIMRVTGNAALAQASFDQAMAGSKEEQLLTQLAQVGAQEAEAQRALAVLEQEEVGLLRIIAKNTEAGFEADLRNAQNANANPARDKRTQDQIDKAEKQKLKAEKALPGILKRNNELTEKLNDLNTRLIELRKAEIDLLESQKQRDKDSGGKMAATAKNNKVIAEAEAKKEKLEKEKANIQGSETVARIPGRGRGTKTVTEAERKAAKDREIETEEKRIEKAKTENLGVETTKVIPATTKKTSRGTRTVPARTVARSDEAKLADIDAKRATGDIKGEAGDAEKAIREREEARLKAEEEANKAAQRLAKIKAAANKAGIKTTKSVQRVPGRGRGKKTVNKSEQELLKELETKGIADNFNRGGIVYRAGGGSIFQPKGTDTVPAMLTPGEFVIRKSAVDKVGVGTLTQLNNGSASTVYRANGGPIGGGGGVQLPGPGAFQRNLVSILNRRGSRRLVAKSLESAGYAKPDQMASAMYALAGKGVIGPNSVRGGKEFDDAMGILRESPYLASTKPPVLRRPDTSALPKSLEGAMQAIGMYKRYSGDLSFTASELKRVSNKRSAKFASDLLKNAGVTKEDLFGNLVNIQKLYLKRSKSASELSEKLQGDKTLIDSSTDARKGIRQALLMVKKGSEAEATLKEKDKAERQKIQAAENRLMTLLFGPGGKGGVVGGDQLVNQATDKLVEKKDLERRTQGLPKKFQDQLKFLQSTGILRLAQGGGVSGMDSVPAMLTPGEFVMSPEAVKQHGVGYMKSLNRGRVPGFRRGGMVGRGNVAYRANGSSNPEAGGGGAILQLDTANIQSVLNEFNVNFGSHVDNMIANLGSFVFAATGLAESINNGMDLRVSFSGDLSTAVKLDGDQTEHLKNAIADNILPKIEKVVSDKIDNKIQELKDNP